MALYSEDAANGVVMPPASPKSPNSIIDYESGAGLLSITSQDELFPPAGPSSSANASEDTPLLGHANSSQASVKRSWLKTPHPFWVVVLAVCASLSRSMVMAPRVEVYTQIACRTVHPAPAHHTKLVFLPTVPPKPALDTVFNIAHDADEDDEPITDEPSPACKGSPAVAAQAAQIQMIMTTVMGVTSAVTAGWWGQFGDRHGRRPVILAAAFGLFFVDVMFVLVSIPHSIFSGHGHRLIYVAPFVEGLMGGWSTFQAAANAYISDCTPHGSRARIFSRVQGIHYILFAMGPELGNFAMHLVGKKSTTVVFYLSISLSLLNFLVVSLLVPESVKPEDMQRRREHAASMKASLTYPDGRPKKTGVFGRAYDGIVSFFAPLSLFVPKQRWGYGSYKDWNLTFLAVAVFGYLLTVALFQIKYVYANRKYDWEQSQLSSYISAMGAVRAAHLLIILPTIIRFFKNHSSRNMVPPAKPASQPSTPPASGHETAAVTPVPAESAIHSLNPAILAREIHFDLMVAKLSLALDITSHSLVTILSPKNSLVFTGFTALSSMGSGLLPAVQSLALCILQASGEQADTGKLFGALSVLQAIGAAMLGPILFGTVFQHTVGKFPEAIFAVAAGILVIAFTLICLIRSRKYVEEGTLAAVRPNRAHWQFEEPEEPPVRKGKGIPRGRSRRSKDLGVSGSAPSV